MPSADRLDAVTFQGRTLEDLPYDAIRAALDTHHLARIRGLFDRTAIRAVKQRMVDAFDVKNDARHDPRDTDAVRRNFQKLQVGANSGVGTWRTLGRFMRVFYNPIFESDVHGMRDHFVRLARFRNLLYNLPIDFAVAGTDDGYWTCSRILQYPAGGGFIVPHRDMYAQAATAERGLAYYQPLLLLTEKGQDFDSGGAYVDIGDARFLYEEFCQAGDIVVYDGRSIHGVSDIDPYVPLDLTRFTGRAVALASLFRLLTPGERDYGQLAERARDWFDSERDQER